MTSDRPFFPSVDASGVVQDWWFWCAGCKRHHAFAVGHSNPRHNWTMTGTPEAPTFRPSLLCEWKDGPAEVPQRCHSFVTDGTIEYLSDCTHALAGTTMTVAPEPPDEGDSP